MKTKKILQQAPGRAIIMMDMAITVAEEDFKILA